MFFVNVRREKEREIGRQRERESNKVLGAVGM
jgi:hypothetical protein